MNVVAGILGLGFALLHGVPSLGAFNEPVASRGSHERAAIPRWARALWLLLAATTLAGSTLYLLSTTVGAAAVTSIGAIGIWGLAIANGFWIHGRPTLSHHVVRGGLVVVLVVLALAGLE